MMRTRFVVKGTAFSGERSGEPKLQEKPFVRAGVEVAQERDFSATLTQKGLTKNLKSFPTSTEFRAGRKEPASLDEAKMRQCNLGEFCLVAAVLRPDICARVARIASRINSLFGSDVYRINGLVRAAKEQQRATVLKYASSAEPAEDP